VPSAALVVIGSADDPHIEAVLTASGHANDAIVVDAQSIQELSWSVGPTSARIGDRVVDSGARGWVRRIAPAGYQNELKLGSVEAAEHSAWLALMTSLMRLDIIDWLSPFEVVMRAEDKVVQYAACEKLGILYPDTVVTSTPMGLRERFGSEVVVKPLGASHFSDAEAQFKIVAAQPLATDDERLFKLAGAPFIVQQRITASAHLRVVTVLAEVFAARLDAKDLPLDWRTEVSAHANFEPFAAPDGVRQGALQLARELGVRYSSQDWAVAEDGTYFLDLNPVGQWLFLPDPVSVGVTNALAAWMSEAPK
jgi:hypothetical protein